MLITPNKRSATRGYGLRTISGTPEDIDGFIPRVSEAQHGVIHMEILRISTDILLLLFIFNS